MLKALWRYSFAAIVAVALAVIPAGVQAQATNPPPGYQWNTSNGKPELRWVPGIRHSSIPNVVAGTKKDDWFPVTGYRWLTDNPNDLRVIVIKAAPQKGPSDEAIGRGVLKLLGAVVLHDNSKPQANDGIGDAILRELSRAGRDELISSALTDLFPDQTGAERGAIRNLILLALDGRMPRDRNMILAQLRKTNPNFANGAEAVELLIRLAQAVDNDRRR